MTEALAQTVLQMGMTNYQPLRSYAVRTFPLCTLYRRYHQHPNMCPAVNEFCRGCGRKGHFLHVCSTTARMQASDGQRGLIKLGTETLLKTLFKF